MIPHPDRLPSFLAPLVRSLALKPSPLLEDELEALIAAHAESPDENAKLKQALVEHHFIYEEPHSIPRRLFLHPELREQLLAEKLEVKRFKFPDLPSLNPTFHPLIPLRLFLAAMAHESYRVLGDESYFFKGSAKKLLAKFSSKPPPQALHFLFHFASHANWMHIHNGKAELALETLYHVNFYQATFFYFCHFLTSRAFVLFPLFRTACPQTWFLRKELDQLLNTFSSIATPTAPHPYLQSHHAFPELLSVEDLTRLGLLTEKTIDRTSYVQANPWYHEWIFDHVPSLKRKRHSDFNERFIAQPNYDILMPPDLAWPSFLQMISLAKAERCDLVCHLKLSKNSIGSALRSGIHADEILSFFEHHAWALPANVKNSLEEWSKLAERRHDAPARDEHDFFKIEELRREANALLALPLAASINDHRKKPGIRLALFTFANRDRKGQKSHATLHPTGNERPAVLQEQKPRLYRDNLLYLEECIREKKWCIIVHCPREGRIKRRSILPLRIHRDGISVFVEAQELDLDIVRSFKLTQILEVM